MMLVLYIHVVGLHDFVSGCRDLGVDLSYGYVFRIESEDARVLYILGILMWMMLGVGPHSCCSIGDVTFSMSIICLFFRVSRLIKYFEGFLPSLFSLHYVIFLAGLFSFLIYTGKCPYIRHMF